MADFSSRINRTAASELGNIRDEPNEDDDEFFGGANDSGEEEGHIRDEFAIETGNKRDVERSYGKNTNGIDARKLNSGNISDVPANTLTANNSNYPSSLQMQRMPLQQPQSSTLGSHRYATNLSKITEVPDESFSFKHGESALQMINEQHEIWLQENYLRLPSGSFHESRYSKKSWEESALRNQLQSTVIRSELDLSAIRISSKANKSIAHRELSQSYDESANKSSHEIPLKELQQLNILPTREKPKDNSQMSNQQNLPLSSSEVEEKTGQVGDVRPFISGNRYALYFGFRQLNVDSEETLSLHNIHPGRERIRLHLWLKGSTCFKIAEPLEPHILKWDESLKVVIAFLPTTTDHFYSYLYVKCESRHTSQKYKFLLQGFGGRAVVRPCMKIQDPKISLLLSKSGRYQLVVNSIKKFHFSLENQGNRAAFASVCIHDRKGPIPTNKIMVNERNVILDKYQQGDFKKEIKIQCFANLTSQKQRITPRPSTKPSVGSAPGSSAVSNKRKDPDPSLQIIVFWGEERQRQRLKQFEKFVNAPLPLFRQNFTRYKEFHGENKDWQQQEQGKNLEQHVSEEDFYYMYKNMKVIFIDVHERDAFKELLNERQNSRAGTYSTQQRRVGSALSVASADGTEKRLMRAHQTIVEIEPDDTLVGIKEAHDDDTLTL